MDLPKPAEPNGAPGEGKPTIVRRPNYTAVPKHPTEARLVQKRPKEDVRLGKTGKGKSSAGTTEE